MSTIPLAKGYNEAKREFPGYLSVKLDGVPIRLDIDMQGPTYSVQSRQGKPVPSVEPFVQAFIQCLIETGTVNNGKHTFVFEVTHKTLRDFKDVSGVVRKKEPQQDLILNCFDYQNHQSPDVSFLARHEVAAYIFRHMSHESFCLVPQFFVSSEAQFEAAKHQLLERYVNCEGLIYRAATGRWAPGKRRWDYMKLLVHPTVDLKIVGFEEAVCGKTGEGKGMVGRLNAEYKGETIGVGPGKLKHAERVFLWENAWVSDEGTRHPAKPGHCCPIAQIKYKRDQSYDALREPTFQCWRPEKTEPSYE